MSGRARAIGCAWLLASLVLAGCTTGGPPPLVTSQVAQTSAPTATANEVIVGVDEFDAGFNPHTLANLGPVSRAVAGLVLPSVFRQDADGALRLDRTLMQSAEVTAQQPFTVSYQLRREASWSDGAPIAAEDFAYLADRMRTEPGVASPAGYRLIRAVSSRAGGKHIDVVFNRPYPGWPTLFADLLPSHLLKDAPGGWAQALRDGIPVSGGPFATRSVDIGRGMVVLERNDRYWEVPSVVDRVVLRQASVAGLVSALSTGGDHLAMLRADGIGSALLRERVPSLTATTVPEPVGVDLLLRPNGPNLTSGLVRAAVAAALNVPDLVAVGSGNGPAGALAQRARTLLPSEAGYTPTLPAGVPTMRADPAEVATLMAAAGYRRIGVQWQRDGVPLEVVVAAPAERDSYVTLATRVVRQLTDAGIDARLVTPPGDQLYRELTGPSSSTAEPSGSSTDQTGATAAGGTTRPGSSPRGVDIAVAPRPVTADPAADLASWYGCPALDADTRTAGPSAPDQALVSNPAGYCNRLLQSAMDDLLSGASSVAEALPAIESTLWRDLPSVPLFQHAVVLVGTGVVAGVGPGGLLAGPLSDAPFWRRSDR